MSDWQDRDLTYLLAEIESLLNDNDYRQAEPLLANLAEQAGSRPEVWDRLAGPVQALKGPEAVEAIFRVCAQAEVKGPAFWHAMARSLYGPLAQEAYRRVLAESPDNREAVDELAWSLTRGGRKEEAMLLYRYLIELYRRDRNAQALNRLGDTLRRLVGALPEAEEALTASLDIDPGAFEVWKNYAYLMCSLRDPARAQQVVRQFIQTYPDHPRLADAWVTLSTVLRGLGDLKGAEAATRQAIAVDPHCQAAWSKLADILFDSERAQEAEDALRRANALDSNARYDGTAEINTTYSGN